MTSNMQQNAMTRCARIGCNMDGTTNISTGTTDARVQARLFRDIEVGTKRTTTCLSHFTEFNSLFETSQCTKDGMHVEIDDSTGCIDFVSNAKSTNKIPDRTMSIMEVPGTTDQFQVMSATHKGNVIDTSALEEYLGSDKPGKRNRNQLSGTCNEISKLRSKFFSSNELDSLTREVKLSSTEEEFPKPFLISLEGNIGAGKSTLLTKLRQLHPDWHFIDEPVDTWTSLKNEKGESLLEIFYADQKRWSYTFQNCALLSRYNLIEEAVRAHNSSVPGGSKKRRVFVTERCLDTDYQVFAKMLAEDGTLDALEHELYKKWFDLLATTATPLSAIVYVDTDPKTCLERIATRGRSGEDGIPIEYLKSLDKTQRAWVNTTSIPVLNVTGFPDASSVGKFVTRMTASDATENVEDNKENVFHQNSFSSTSDLKNAADSSSIKSNPLREICSNN